MLRIALPLLCSMLLHASLGWWLLAHSRVPAAAERFPEGPVFAVSLVTAAPSRPVPAALRTPQPERPRVQPNAAAAKVGVGLRRASSTASARTDTAVAASPAPPVERPAEPASGSAQTQVLAQLLPEVLVQRPSFRLPPAPPRYPAQARLRRLQGKVWVEVRLDEAGRQRDCRVLQSSGVALLDQAALEAVSRWQFNPERVGGQAVPSRVRIPIEFNLRAAR